MLLRDQEHPGSSGKPSSARYSVYLLYWYKSTKVRSILTARGSSQAPGTQFTCFTGTKVQILTHEALLARGRPQAPSAAAPPLLQTPGTRFTCFTGTKVQILIQHLRLSLSSAIERSLSSAAADASSCASSAAADASSCSRASVGTPSPSCLLQTPGTAGLLALQVQKYECCSSRASAGGGPSFSQGYCYSYQRTNTDAVTRTKVRRLTKKALPVRARSPRDVRQARDASFTTAAYYSSLLQQLYLQLLYYSATQL
jgi:hypothetical protein